jgi:hypothetical protein
MRVIRYSRPPALRAAARGRIAASLRTAGCMVEVHSVNDAGDLAAYDAFVITRVSLDLSANNP